MMLTCSLEKIFRALLETAFGESKFHNRGIRMVAVAVIADPLFLYVRH